MGPARARWGGGQTETVVTGDEKQRWVGSRLSFHMSVYDHFCLCHHRSCSVEGRGSELQWVIFNKGISRGALIGGGGSDIRCVQLFTRCVWNSSWWMWRTLFFGAGAAPQWKSRAVCQFERLCFYIIKTCVILVWLESKSQFFIE